MCIFKITYNFDMSDIKYSINIGCLLYTLKILYIIVINL